jgi:hypothetical protein
MAVVFLIHRDLEVIEMERGRKECGGSDTRVRHLKNSRLHNFRMCGSVYIGCGSGEWALKKELSLVVIGACHNL